MEGTDESQQDRTLSRRRGFAAGIALGLGIVAGQGAGHAFPHLKLAMNFAGFALGIAAMFAVAWTMRTRR